MGVRMTHADKLKPCRFCGRKEVDPNMVIHILRNPWGYNQEELRRNHIAAAELIEALSIQAERLPEPQPDPKFSNYQTEGGQ